MHIILFTLIALVSGTALAETPASANVDTASNTSPAKQQHEQSTEQKGKPKADNYQQRNQRVTKTTSTSAERIGPPPPIAKHAIRDLLANDDPLIINRVQLHKQELTKLYSPRDYRPIWLRSNGGLTPLAEELITFLTGAELHGLNPLDYNLGIIRARIELKQDPPATDLYISRMVLDFIHHVTTGRYDPESIGADKIYKTRAIDEVMILSRALKSRNVIGELDKLGPSHDQYHLLRNGLKKLINMHGYGGLTFIPEGKTLYPQAADSRVPLLRKRLIEGGWLSPETPVFNNVIGGSRKKQNEYYDQTMVDAVRRFQYAHQIDDDGIIGPKTVKHLNIPVLERIRKVKLNMERWRWLPEDFGDQFIIVNIPTYWLYAIKDNEELFSMPVIVGKPEHQTPTMISKINEVSFNPYWTATQRIAVDYVIPRLAKNPELAEQEGFELLHYVDGRLQRAEGVDWTKLTKYTKENLPYFIRQKPGISNALGKVRFNLVGGGVIYMHGTPQAHLFDSDSRNYSSGCVRIKEPDKLANLLLEGNSDFAPEKVHEYYYGEKSSDKGNPASVKTQAEPMPLYMIYMTTWAQKDGTIIFREDKYNRDRFLETKLTL